MQVSQLIIAGATKQASKAAASKAAPKAPKGKQTRAAAPAVVATRSAIKFAVVDFARPSAGNALAAHTQAFLDMSGLASGDAFPKAQATKIIGARAVQYHLGNGNFTQVEKGIKLTEKGELFFLSRNVDAELFAAYSTFFASGKVNDAINVKAETSIVKL